MGDLHDATNNSNAMPGKQMEYFIMRIVIDSKLIKA